MSLGNPLLHKLNDSLTIERPCGAPAPLAMSGAGYVGCSLTKGHDGPHEVKIVWTR